MYKIIRFYFNAGIKSRVIQSHVTKEEARKHCASVEASSKTCTKPSNKARTRKLGAWFDGYDLM